MKRNLSIITCIVIISMCSGAFAQGGTVEYNSVSPPSYSPKSSLLPNSIFVVVPIVLSVISGIFVVVHIILKKKNIPSRPYLVLMLSAVLLFFGVPNFIQILLSLFMVSINIHLLSEDWIVTFVPLILINFSLVFVGVYLLVRSKIIREKFGL